MNNEVIDLLGNSDFRERIILDFLKDEIGELDYVYVLNWIPEQGCTIYILIVNDMQVVFLELGEEEIIDFKIESFREFKRKHPKLSAEQNRRLASIMKQLGIQ